MRRAWLAMVGCVALWTAARPVEPALAQSPGAAGPAKTGAGVPESNLRTERRLREIFAATDWKGDPNKPAERVRYFQMLLGSGRLTPAQQMVVYPQLTNEALRAGDPAGALAALDAEEALLAKMGPGVPAAAVRQLHETRAVAFLRLGEQENCLEMHGQRSCVFPLRAAAVHAKPRGAEGAVREFTWLLQHDPEDARSRWLLNVAYMQLGRYPRDVPRQWLLPASLFRSEAEVGDFGDYAGLAGVDVLARSGGALMEDFDGDGLLDLVTSSSGPLDPMHFFHNNGDGTFADRTAQSGLGSELGGLNLVVGDYDNDGRPDILVLRGGWWGGAYGSYPMSLLHNLGGGRFEDVTERVGLLRAGPTQTAAWADFDGDGRPDLFVGYESAPGDVHPSLLFHNDGDGTFTEMGKAAGLADQGFVKGVAWGDFNNDGRPDLYISTRGGRNRLYRNDGPADPAHPDAAHWRFTDVTEKAGVGGVQNGFATWFFDYDNDGWPDLFVAGYSTESMQDVGRFEAGQPAHAEKPHLFHNNGDGTFTDVAHATGLDRAILTMGANFGDLDNDGWLDVYLGTGEPSYEALLPNRMFRNDGGRRFQDVTTAGGFGHLQKGHAIAFGDLERRGQEDVFEEMGGAFPGDAYQSALYRNPGHPGHWITVKLEGVRSNRMAYGARIEVVCAGEGGRPRHIFRTVGAVSSFGGNPSEQHIGLGPAERVEEVRVRWPADWNHAQVFRGLAADRYYVLREDSGEARGMVLHPFDLGATRKSAPAMPPMH